MRSSKTKILKTIHQHNSIIGRDNCVNNKITNGTAAIGKWKDTSLISFIGMKTNKSLAFDTLMSQKKR